MLIVLLEVSHHVCQPSLSCGLCPLFLDLAHLLKVLLGCWIKFRVDSVLCVQGSALGLAHVIDFEPAAHGGMHHDLSRSLHLLEAVEGDVVQVTGAIEVSLFVPHHLFEQIVPPCLPLLLLEQQVIGRCNLVVLVVLDVSHCLVQVAVRADATRHEAVLDLA